MCPYQNDDARRLWAKACNYHRGTDMGHNCSNPSACQRTLDQAESAEEWHLRFVERWQ